MELNFKDFSRILITGGSGFIGSNLILKLLKEHSIKVYNIDKLGYAADNYAIDSFLDKSVKSIKDRYNFIKCDLSDELKIESIVEEVKPDLVIHLAAESHVDNSITDPKVFIDSNIVGTFNLLSSCLRYYLNLDKNRKKKFRFLHVSTDEVFGSLFNKEKFSESSKYDPRSPYSASKAGSDHIVRSWFHTYDFPILITNCGNNYGPWQFPEKLIPTIIFNAINSKEIPIYGNGLNIRDWIYVEDHINAIFIVLLNGKIGESYCIGSNQEFTNIEIARKICLELDRIKPKKIEYSNLIKFVEDRPGHDKRYAINALKIRSELGWSPKYSFQNSLEITIRWYLKNIDWCNKKFKNCSILEK